MLIKQGTNFNEIGVIQNALNVSTNFVPKLTVDGIFGPKSDSRVKQFQSAKNLAPDGAVGPKTLNALFVHMKLEALITVIKKPVNNPPQPGFTPPGFTPPSFGPPVPPSPSFSFNPFVVDPRDLQWHAQVQAWREWVMKPIPKGPAPPLPADAPPSLSLPPQGLSVPLLPSETVNVSSGGVATRTVPFTGANFETAFTGNLKDGKFKQEFTVKLDFTKVTGLINTKAVEQEIEVGKTQKGDFEITHNVKVTPFKIINHEGNNVDFKLAPLLITSVNSSFDASQFGGIKSIVTFRPFGKGFEIEVGGKIGSKFKLSHDENNRATTSVYPLTVEGIVGFKFDAL